MLRRAADVENGIPKLLEALASDSKLEGTHRLFGQVWLGGCARIGPDLAYAMLLVLVHAHDCRAAQARGLRPPQRASDGRILLLNKAHYERLGKTDSHLADVASPPISPTRCAANRPCLLATTPRPPSPSPQTLPPARHPATLLAHSPEEEDKLLDELLPSGDDDVDEAPDDAVSGDEPDYQAPPATTVDCNDMEVEFESSGGADEPSGNFAETGNDMDEAGEGVDEASGGDAEAGTATNVNKPSGSFFDRLAWWMMNTTFDKGKNEGNDELEREFGEAKLLALQRLREVRMKMRKRKKTGDGAAAVDGETCAKRACRGADDLSSHRCTKPVPNASQSRVDADPGRLGERAAIYQSSTQVSMGSRTGRSSPFANGRASTLSTNSGSSRARIRDASRWR